MHWNLESNKLHHEGYNTSQYQIGTSENNLEDTKGPSTEPNPTKTNQGSAAQYSMMALVVSWLRVPYFSSNEPCNSASYSNH